MFTLHKSKLLIITGIAFIALLLAQQFLQLPSLTPVQRAFNNFLHAPLFYLLTIIVWLQLSAWQRFRRTFQQHELITKVVCCLGVCLLLSVVTELLQVLNARDASLADVTRDILGSGAALLTVLAQHYWHRKRLLLVSLSLIFAMLLTVFAARSLINAWLTSQQRQALAPALVNFDSALNTALSPLGSTLRIVDAEQGWSQFSGQKVVEVTLEQARRSGIALMNPFPDWSAYQSINFSIYLPDDEPITLLAQLSTYSAWGQNSRLSFTLQTGHNELRFPLRSLLTESEDSLSGVKRFRLFSDGDYPSRKIIIGDIHLAL